MTPTPPTADPLVATSLLPVPLPDPGRYVAVAGDWHGNTAWARKVLRSLSYRRIRVLLHVGDLGVWPGEEGAVYLDDLEHACAQYGITVLFLDGNHEDFGQLEAAERDEAGIARLRPHIWHLPRGLRWTWAGIGFAAMGGATSLDVGSRRAHVSWWPQEALRPHQRQQLVDGGQVDVLLTHDCPSGTSIPGLSDQWPPAALAHAIRHRKALREAVDQVAPTHLIHGHFHVAYRDQLTLTGATTAAATVVVGLAGDGSSYDDNVVLLNLPELALAVNARRGGDAADPDRGLIDPKLGGALNSAPHETAHLEGDAHADAE